jgi:hypothetical protein
VGQRYSDFNACQEQADIHQGLLVRSGERLFSPQLFFSTFQKWHSKFATHRQAAGLQCSTLGIDQAQFGYHEEEEVQGCGLTAIPTLNA